MIKKFNERFEENDFDYEEEEFKILDLIPVLDASYFSTEIEDELSRYDINTHYQNDVFGFDWNGNDFPSLKSWLLKTYGDNVKNYRSFAILST